jgi:hypothetical protein
MPRRTKAFQKLIASLEQAIAGNGGTVEESVLLTNAHGEEQEVDVLLTYPVPGRVFREALECRDYKRAQTVEWIQQLIGKYQSLPVDRKTAVSSTTFSRKARALAARNGINVVTLEKALQWDWTERMDRQMMFELAPFP